MKFDGTEIALLSTTAVLLILSFLLPVGAVDRLLFSLSLALAVLGLILLSRCGLISFGHALYFGIGGYTVAVLSKGLGVTDIVLRLMCGVLAAGAVAFVLGFILRRYRGIFFAMLSLAFSMVLYGALVKAEWLGSTDGFPISSSTLLTLPLGAESRRILLAATVLLFCVAAFATNRFLRSILGSIGEAIRDSEIRVSYLGFSVAHTIHVNYVISALLTAAGGAMTAMAIGQVDPDSMVNWTISGDLIFVAILSGYGSVLAPAAGSILFEFLRTYALQIAPQGWHFIVGATLVVFIFLLPRGIWSLVDRAALGLKRSRP
jgi:ABC-type branched-subunit amino acid transport system permease subunit